MTSMVAVWMTILMPKIAIIASFVKVVCNKPQLGKEAASLVRSK